MTTVARFNALQTNNLVPNSTFRVRSKNNIYPKYNDPNLQTSTEGNYNTTGTWTWAAGSLTCGSNDAVVYANVGGWMPIRNNGSGFAESNSQFRFQVQITTPPTLGGQDGGVVVWDKATNSNFYRAVIASSTLYLQKYVGGTYTTLASTAMTVTETASTKYWILMDVYMNQSGDLSLYGYVADVNWNAVSSWINYVDNSPLAGSFAIGATSYPNGVINQLVVYDAHADKWNLGNDSVGASWVFTPNSINGLPSLTAQSNISTTACYMESPHFSVNPSTTYTASMYVNCTSVNGGQIFIRLIEWNSSGTPLNPTSLTGSYNMTTVTNGFVRITGTFTTQSTTSTITFRPQVDGIISVEVTCLQLEQGSQMTSYQNNDAIDGAWAVRPAGSLQVYGEIVEERILKHSATCNAPASTNAYDYRDIWHGTYTPQSGDILYFDMYESSANPAVGQIGIDCSVTGNSNNYTSLRGYTNFVDTNGMGSVGYSTSVYPTDQWHTRQFNIGSIFAANGGGIINNLNVLFEGDPAGNYLAYYRRMYVVDANGRKKLVFFENMPSYVLPAMGTGAGTNDYVSSVITTVRPMSLGLPPFEFGNNGDIYMADEGIEGHAQTWVGVTLQDNANGYTNIVDSSALSGQARYAKAGTNASGYISYGPYTTALAPTGFVTVYWRLKASANTSTSTVVTLDVNNNTGGTTGQLAVLNVTGTMFGSPMEYQWFSLTFKATATTSGFEFRTFYQDVCDIYLDEIIVVQNDQTLVNPSMDSGGNILLPATFSDNSILV